MTIYARIQDGVVIEIIEPMMDEDGAEIPVSNRFHPDFVATLVDVTTTNPLPADHWLAVETEGAWSFSAPPVPISAD